MCTLFSYLGPTREVLLRPATKRIRFKIMRMEEKEHKDDRPLDSNEAARKREKPIKLPGEESKKELEGTIAAHPKNGDTIHENNLEQKVMDHIDEDDFQKTTVGNHGRAGLSSEEADILYEEVGFNELKHVEVSAIKLFFLQLTGLMPYVLEIAAIISIAILEYVDFAIILAILLANATLGYYEEMKAKKSLVGLFVTFSFGFISFACSSTCRLN